MVKFCQFCGCLAVETVFRSDWSPTPVCKECLRTCRLWPEVWKVPVKEEKCEQQQLS